MRVLSILCLALAGLSLTIAPSLAGGSKAGPVTGEAHHWYDGERKRTIHLDPQIVAEFTAPNGARGASAAGLELAEEVGGVRFWRAQAQTGKAITAVSAQAARDTGGKFSPVFQKRGVRGRMALPGGVIVEFSREWSDAQCAQWIAGRGLEIARKMTVGKQIYVLKTPAGMASLELANEIYESGEVVSASPNWWSEAELK